MEIPIPARATGAWASRPFAQLPAPVVSPPGDHPIPTERRSAARAVIGALAWYAVVLGIAGCGGDGSAPPRPTQPPGTRAEPLGARIDPAAPLPWGWVEDVCFAPGSDDLLFAFRPEFETAGRAVDPLDHVILRRAAMDADGRPSGALSLFADIDMAALTDTPRPQHGWWVYGLRFECHDDPAQVLVIAEVGPAAVAEDRWTAFVLLDGHGRMLDRTAAEAYPIDRSVFGWSPDGRWLAIERHPNGDIALLKVPGFVPSPLQELSPPAAGTERWPGALVWRADSRWLAAAARETMPGLKESVRLVAVDGPAPHWSGAAIVGRPGMTPYFPTGAEALALAVDSARTLGLDIMQVGLPGGAGSASSAPVTSTFAVPFVEDFVDEPNLSLRLLAICPATAPRGNTPGTRAWLEVLDDTSQSEPERPVAPRPRSPLAGVWVFALGDGPGASATPATGALAGTKFDTPPDTMLIGSAFDASCARQAIAWGRHPLTYTDPFDPARDLGVIDVGGRSSQ